MCLGGIMVSFMLVNGEQLNLMLYHIEPLAKDVR